MRKLYRFNGGVHPPEHKHESSGTPIAAVPLPARLAVPLQQSVGKPAVALVKAGERVLKGQMLAEADGALSSAVHAPSSGRVLAVEKAPVAHPSGLADWCVLIETDGLDEWAPRLPLDWRTAPAEQLRQHLRDMGVVGLGGAVFPTHLKTTGSRTVPLETLVINGAECEPYITCDDRLMRERAAGIVAGVAILAQLMQPREVVVGIEDNKPEAIAAMRAAITAAGLPFTVAVIPTLYPSGGAKQLIRVLTGKEVPSGVRSTELGVQCFNVGTAYTIHRAVEVGEPVISRIVTVTGNVKAPGNFEALLGMPVGELVAAAGGALPDTNRLIMGGPMMGINLEQPAAGVAKATNCLLAGSEALFPPRGPALPCIRCGQCAEACPASLQPMDMYWFAKARQFGRAQEWHLFDCIECGACSYVCPSEIPLVDYFRFAKTEIWAADREKKAADQARERHEFRVARLEREKQEKAARLAAKTQDAKKPAASAEDDKAAKIRAAMEKAAAQRAAVAPKNTEVQDPAVLQQIAEQDALAAQAQASKGEQAS